MADGGDAGEVGSDRRADVVLLVDDDIGGVAIQQRRQVRGRARGEHVEEHPGADLDVGSTSGILRHLGSRQRRQELRPSVFDGEPHVVGREALPPERGEEAPGRGEADLVAGAPGGEGQGHERIDVAVCGPGAEHDLHGGTLGGRSSRAQRSSTGGSRHAWRTVDDLVEFSACAAGRDL
jgi:hypothetical protein